MDLIKNSVKSFVFTVIFDYQGKNYIYQFLANNEIEAKMHWVKTINLDEIGVENIKKVKLHLMEDAMNKDFYPYALETPLGKLQSVWDASVSASDFGDSKISATANIVATVPSKQYFKGVIKKNDCNESQTLFNFSKMENLYTIQLDYKGGTYVDQVFANDPVHAKIKWIKQLNFKEIFGAPENIEKIKNDILLEKNDPDFIPQELKDFDSVWSTTVQLGDEVGRVTIVATQTDFLHSDRL